MKTHIGPSGKLFYFWNKKTIFTVHDEQQLNFKLLGKYKPSSPSTNELHDLILFVLHVGLWKLGPGYCIVVTSKRD